MTIRSLWCVRALFVTLCAVCLFRIPLHAAITLPVGTVVPVGAGGYTITTGYPSWPAPCVTSNVTAPINTNDWDSSFFSATMTHPVFPHPLEMKAVSGGLQVFYPGPTIAVSTNAVSSPTGDDFVLGIQGAGAFTSAPVDSFSDWFVTAAFTSGTQTMKTSFGHGSPFVYALYTNGNPSIAFAATPTVWSGNANSAVLGVTVNGNNYALFGPTGSTWTGIGTANLVCNSGGLPYFSVALLPQGDAATLSTFQQYAYSFVTNTVVSWSYNETTSIVTTTFTFTTHQYEGTQTGTITALYLHQWMYTTATLLNGTYQSIRGLMKITAGDSFSTNIPYTGVLPALPNEVSAAARPTLMNYLRSDVLNTLPTGALSDTYDEGKNFGRTAVLAAIADAAGDPVSSKMCLNNLKSRFQQYLTASHWGYYETWGTLIGTPASYGSDTNLNDHHFHYGYFVHAAAEVARQNPSWATDAQWGGMVNLLIREYACPDHGDAMFPFLRMFDPYESHSWADGSARDDRANNQESSSEAMNAYSGIILWGAATGNTKVRDLGIYLYTSEMTGVLNYWFDVNSMTLPTGYGHAMASMVWSANAEWATWFSGDPTWFHVINYMPITGGSLYLGNYPANVQKNYLSLVAEKGGEGNFSGPVDICYMYKALYDPSDVVSTLNFATCSLEPGDSRTNLYYWCQNLNTVGQVDCSVTANTPLYAVFKNGTTRTYVAYNETTTPLTVTFSDGKVLTAPMNGYGVATGPAS